MCGRFFLESSIEDIFKYYGIMSAENNNIEISEKCPGTTIPVVVGGDTKRLEYFRWGYRTFGSKEIINARIETVQEKKSFKGAIEAKRCIVPANAFFEWCRVGKDKAKYKIQMDNQRIFSMAALYNTFINENNEEYKGVAILTKPSYGKMASIHHRMPVILSKSIESHWLGNGSLTLAMLKELGEMDSDDRVIIEPVRSIIQLDFFSKLQ